MNLQQMVIKIKNCQAQIPGSFFNVENKVIIYCCFPTFLLHFRPE